MACKQTQNQDGIESYPKLWASLISDQELGQVGVGGNQVVLRVGGRAQLYEGLLSLNNQIRL
jgi:hypothetical protein